MITEEIFLKDVREMLSIEDGLTLDTDLMDVENWDSFSMMSFIAMAGEKYNIELQPFSIAGAIYIEDLYNEVINAMKEK